MKRTRAFINKYVPTFTLLSLTAAVVCLLLYFSTTLSYSVADAVNSTVSTAFRFIMAKISGIFPFSVFETLMYSLIPLLGLLIFLAVRAFRDPTSRIRYAFTLLGVVLIIYSGYLLALAIPYNVTPLGTRLEIEEVEINAENLYDTAKLLLDEANALASRLEFDESGSAVMPYSLDELSRMISAGYASLAEKQGFLPGYSSRVKPVLTNGAMSSLHLLGIYTYFTGESNINVDYPDFNLPFTTAHEFAHQRGVIRENEANFIAFLVCLESDDDFIRYSGYLQLYEYVASALYRTDVERYRELISDMSDAVRGELVADSEVYEKYADGFIGKISRKLNDVYLKMNGTEGEISYGLVTRLAVAYYESK